MFAPQIGGEALFFSGPMDASKMLKIVHTLPPIKQSEVMLLLVYGMYYF